MGRTVVIAEKPSVGRDIARVLGCQSSGRGCLTGGDWGRDVGGRASGDAG